MVSLSRSFNTNSGGATFFSESVNMDDRERLVSILDSFGGFKKLPTVPLFSLHLLFTLILNIVAIVYACIHPNETSKCSEYFIIIYIHIALWFFTAILRAISAAVHYKVRLNGYLDFHKKIESDASVLFVLVSLWNIILFIVQTAMEHTFPDNFINKCLEGGSLSPRAYVCGLIIVEFFTVAGVHISYMRKVIEFNKQQPPPDVLKNEWVISANPETFSQNEVGYREMGSKVYDFLEKQAELIQYLKEHNAKLSEKVMQLTSQLKTQNLSGSGNSTADT